jgi:hypothetical protein
MSSKKHVVQLSPVPEGVNIGNAFALEDIIAGKVDLPDIPFFVVDGEQIPVPHGSVKNYARKLVADGMNPKTKVVFSIDTHFSPEETQLLSRMAETERNDWLKKNLSDKTETPTKREKKS